MAERAQGDEGLRLISELLDGKLAGEERAEALRRIEGDERLYEVFVETARYREEHRESRESWWKRHRVAAVGGLLAASMVTAVLVPRWAGVDPLAPQALASALTADDRLVSTMAEPYWWEPRWSSMRGPTVTPAVASKVGFRTGALGLTLEVALAERRAVAGRSVALRLGQELGRDSALSISYELLAEELRDDGDIAWREATELAAELAASAAETPGLDSLNLTFGRWCEAGRLAAASGNFELLTDEDFQALLPRLLERGGWGQEVAAELDRLNDLLRPELNELQATAAGVAFEAILAER